MPRIERLYAYIVEDSGPDDEGVAATSTPAGLMMPLIGADAARVSSLRPEAERIAREFGKPVKLVCFSQREHLGTVHPDGSG
jgi:hypothetical protein